jgi:hypothetical protein
LSFSNLAADGQDADPPLCFASGGHHRVWPCAAYANNLH